MKNIYLLLAVILITSCAVPEDTEINKQTATKKPAPAVQEIVPVVDSKLDLSTDASFEGEIYACMRDAFIADGIDLNSDLQGFHTVLSDLGWINGVTGKDYYDMLQSRMTYEPTFSAIPTEAIVFSEYSNSGASMSNCKITLVSQRTDAYKSSKMFKLDNVQSGYKSDGTSVYLQLLDVYKQELSVEDLEQPYYKFSVQYIIYLYWSTQKVQVLPEDLPRN